MMAFGSNDGLKKESQEISLKFAKLHQITISGNDNERKRMIPFSIANVRFISEFYRHRPAV
jgi:hypothetical protein